jgi:hypothetical protein
MITATAAIPDVYSAHDAEASMTLSPLSSSPESIMLIPLSHLLLMESMLGADECFGDGETEYAFG